MSRRRGRVHFRRLGGGYLCGVGRRWGSQFISSTTSPATVTCIACRRALDRAEVVELR